MYFSYKMVFISIIFNEINKPKFCINQEHVSISNDGLKKIMVGTGIANKKYYSWSSNRVDSDT